MSRPDSEAGQLADALLAGTHSPKALAAEFGPASSPAVDLTGKTPDELEELRGSEVLLTPAIASYLKSGDDLTHAIIDNAELALEKHYSIEKPFFITSRRYGKEGQGLAPIGFFLDKEE